MTEGFSQRGEKEFLGPIPVSGVLSAARLLLFAGAACVT